ncbi:MAG: ArsR/SmtB family transcription factor [Lutispora sp.]|jgi:DNA-binding transcriptional ArsR family regulator|uniref:ArsR/SmtB family transcription factor n=1 Tax=Lutispora sp. TaxID=2828727 RepID=UPI003567AAA4
MGDDKAKIDSCEINIIHEDIVKRISENMPDENLLYDMADLFRVFGDSTRVKILHALFESEMCVCDIAALLNMNQSAISHQLRVLKGSRLVKNRRDGKVVYYSLDDEHVKHIFDQAMAHLKHK